MKERQKKGEEKQAQRMELVLWRSEQHLCDTEKNEEKKRMKKRKKKERRKKKKKWEANC